MNFEGMMNKLGSASTWIINRLDFIIYKKHYKKLLKECRLDIIKMDLRPYRKRWKKCKKYYSSLDFQLFSRYIGADLNIVPECISHNIIEPVLNPVKYRAFYEDKNMFDKMLPTGFFPKTFFRVMEGVYYNDSYEKIDEVNNEVIYKLLKEAERVVVKPTIGSSSGNGVELFVLSEGVYSNINTKEVLDDNYLKVRYNGDCIVQEALVQSSALSKYNPSSINTLRLLTYRSVKDNKSRVINAALRVGKKGSHLDNAHAGGVIVGVDNQGKLGQFCVNQYGEVFDKVNDITLKDQEHFIPDWDNVMDFACRVADGVVHHRLLSLDVALCRGNKDGEETIEPKLLEYNLSSLGTWAWQFTIKSVYNDYTDEILDYCMKNNQTKVYLARN